MRDTVAYDSRENMLSIRAISARVNEIITNSSNFDLLISINESNNLWMLCRYHITMTSSEFNSNQLVTLIHTIITLQMHSNLYEWYDMWKQQHSGKCFKTIKRKKSRTKLFLVPATSPFFPICVSFCGIYFLNFVITRNEILCLSQWLSGFNHVNFR